MVTNFHIFKYQTIMYFQSFFTIFVTFQTLTMFILDRFKVLEDALAKVAAIRSGATEVAGITRERFIRRLAWIKPIYRIGAITPSQKRTYERIVHVEEMLKLDDSNGKIRKQPYCILITGLPGCGKSRFAMETAIACLKSHYGKAHPSDLVTLNETDEYQSEYRSSHKVVIFDDVAAVKYVQGGSNPWRKIIDFVNNIRKTSLNPNVEMKGNVYIEPDLVIITTNRAIPYYGVLSWMEAPGAIYRRLSKQILLNPDFKTGGFIQLEKSQYPKNNDVAYDNDYTFHMPGKDDSKSSPMISREEIIQEVVQDFERHLCQQEHFIQAANALFDKTDDVGVFRSFYDDMIYPWLPKKIPMEFYLEQKLPWTLRLQRKFCVTYKEGSMHIVAQDSAIELSKDCKITNEILESQCNVVKSDSSENSFLNWLMTRLDWLCYKGVILPRVQGSVEKPEYINVRNDDHIFDRYSYETHTQGLFKRKCKILISIIQDAFKIWGEKNLSSNHDVDDSSIQTSDNQIDVSAELYSPDTKDLINLDFEDYSQSSNCLKPKVPNKLILKRADDLFINESELRIPMSNDPYIQVSSHLSTIPLSKRELDVILSRPSEVKYVGRLYPIHKQFISLIFTLILDGVKVYFVTEVAKEKEHIADVMKIATFNAGILQTLIPKAIRRIAIGFSKDTCSMSIVRQKKFKHTRYKVEAKWHEWYTNYLDRCGAVETEDVICKDDIDCLSTSSTQSDPIGIS